MRSAKPSASGFRPGLLSPPVSFLFHGLDFWLSLLLLSSSSSKSCLEMLSPWVLSVPVFFLQLSSTPHVRTLTLGSTDHGGRIPAILGVQPSTTPSPPTSSKCSFTF